jgi:hypothetical protein
MRRFAITLGSVALASLVSAPAFAQSISVGGQISVGIPPIVVPTIPAAPPAAPPPQAYPAPRPVVVYGQPAPQPRYVYVRETNWGAEKLGLDLRLDGAAGFGSSRFHSAYGLGGGGIGLRYRALPHLGFEGGIDLLGGRDYNDKNRFEVVGSAGALVFFNPRSRAQLYLSGGLLLDHARNFSTSSTGKTDTITLDQTYNHFGGYAGLGLEMFATRHIAFHLDGRGMIRQKIGGSSGPEFTDPATGRTTNTSGGFVGTAGMTIYF